MTSEEMVSVISEYKEESASAKASREIKDDINFDAYLGIQDFSNKQKGQSREFLPKVPMAVEQSSAFIKKALVDFGDWFDVDYRGNENILTGPQIRKWVREYLEKNVNFSTLVADATKIGLLKSLMVAKVYAKPVKRTKLILEKGKDEIALKEATKTQWDVCVELIDPRNYFPDPSGRGLYEIHTVYKDLHEVVALAEEGVYDKSAVAQLQEDIYNKDAEAEAAKAANQDTSTAPTVRKVVQLDEFWGTILDKKGKVVHRNVVCTIANESHMIRKPKPYPYWMNSSPFVSTPLVRVPFSVWHKALFDHATSLNFALNELFNLMLDGGLASVWGIKQLRVGDLEDPGQVSGGIPQGSTLKTKQTLPVGGKVLETVATGSVPPEALAMYSSVDREFQAASLVNDIKLGLLPPRQVKATEIIESSQQSAVFFDGMIRDIETWVGKIIEKVWGMLLQYSDDMDLDFLVNCLGIEATTTLSLSTAEERYFHMSQTAKFRVNGLSSIMSRMKDFQKLMALLNAVTTNPILLQSFTQKFSSDKVLAQIIKTLNINPENIEMSKEEKAQYQDKMKQLPAYQQLISGEGMTAGNTGDASLVGGIYQDSAPTDMMKGGI